MDVPDHFRRARLTFRVTRRLLACRRVQRSLVVEAIQIAASLLELLYPPLRLCNHHVTIKSSLPAAAGGFRDVRPDLGDYGRTESHVGDKVPVHDVDVEPVCAHGDCIAACFAKGSEVCG